MEIEYKIMHVPRTGGTTLKRSLVDGYRIQKGRYLKSDIPGVYFCHHYEKIGGDCKYIIFIRDPVERIVSHFYYFRNRDNAGYDTDGYYRAVTPEYLKQFEDVNDFAMRVDMTGLILAKMYNGFAYALDNLGKYKDSLFFVGRTENLEEDFYKMQEKLGVSEPFPLKHDYENRTPKDLDVQPLKDKPRKRLKRLLQADYKAIHEAVN